MAVYTHIDAPALARLAEDYGLDAIITCKGIAEGVQNSNFLVATGTTRYILTLYEEAVAPEDLPFFLGLMRHLADAGLTCPTPVARPDGSLLTELAGRPAALMHFLDGVSINAPTPAHCHVVGVALAELHHAARDFPQSRRNALGVGDWPSLYARCRTDSDAAPPDMAQAIEDALAHLGAHWPEGLPSGIIHADFFPDNVFFLDDKLSGVIDFYFACNDFLAYDLAIALNAWGFDAHAQFDTANAAALFAGYRSGRDLAPEEIAALPVLAAGAALRFLLTRLHDRIHHLDGALVVPKDPMDYLHRLQFHRRVESAAAYGLEA